MPKDLDKLFDDILNRYIGTLKKNSRSVIKKSVTVGVEKYSLNKFPLNIYPNPTHDKMSVISETETQKVTLINSLGQEILVLNNPLPNQEIDISNFPSGIYFLKAENKQTQGVYKIVKE